MREGESWGSTKSSDARDRLSVVSIPWAQGSAWLHKSLHDTQTPKDTHILGPG